MQTIPAVLLGGPFTVARAVELGVSPDVLRGRRFRSPFPGVRVPADLPDSLEMRCAAAALALPPHAAFSHETAAALLGLPLPFGASADPVQVSVPSGCVAPQLRAVVAHRVQWAEDDVAVRRGLRVTSQARTWCDLAGSGLGTTDLVACADFVLRWRGVRGREALAAATARWGGRRGSVALRGALALAQFRVDSPMETRLRLLLLDAGLPAPDVNLPVRDRFGEIVHTPDLSWPRWRVACDYDGGHHLRYDHDADVAERKRDNWRRRHDISRQEQLQAIGWVLRIATAHDVLHARDEFVARVRSALRAAGAPL